MRLSKKCKGLWACTCFSHLCRWLAVSFCQKCQINYCMMSSPFAKQSFLWKYPFHIIVDDPFPKVIVRLCTRCKSPSNSLYIRVLSCTLGYRELYFGNHHAPVDSSVCWSRLLWVQLRSIIYFFCCPKGSYFQHPALQHKKLHNARVAKVLRSNKPRWCGWSS